MEVYSMPIEALFRKRQAQETRQRIEGRVQKFAIQHFIEILKNCVECAEKPRGDIDEATAKEIVLRRSGYLLENERFVGTVLEFLCSRFLVFMAYTIELQRKTDLAPISLDVIEMKGKELLEVEWIQNYLSGLKSDEFNQLLTRAADACFAADNLLEYFLGRAVWEFFYQPGKKELPAAYGRIIYP